MEHMPEWFRICAGITLGLVAAAAMHLFFAVCEAMAEPPPRGRVLPGRVRR